MRLKIFFIALVIFLQLSFSSGTILAASRDDPSPKLSVDSMFYDYGEVSRGEIISHSFVFKNLGSGDLEIKDAHPD